MNQILSLSFFFRISELFFVFCNQLSYLKVEIVFRILAFRSSSNTYCYPLLAQKTGLRIVTVTCMYAFRPEFFNISTIWGFLSFLSIYLEREHTQIEGGAEEGGENQTQR